MFFDPFLRPPFEVVLTSTVAGGIVLVGAATEGVPSVDPCSGVCGVREGADDGEEEMFAGTSGSCWLSGGSSEL